MTAFLKSVVLWLWSHPWLTTIGGLAAALLTYMNLFNGWQQIQKFRQDREDRATAEKIRFCARQTQISVGVRVFSETEIRGWLLSKQANRLDAALDLLAKDGKAKEVGSDLGNWEIR